MFDRIRLWSERNMPTRETFEGIRILRPIAHRILLPELWRFHRRSVPRGVALGVIVGVLIPVAQTVFAALFALPARANVPVAAVTTFITNPLTTPPIWVGGQGEQVTLRIVAQRADGWACDMLPLDTYRQKLDALTRHCERAGRDPQTVRKMLHFPAIISDDPQLVQRRAEAQAQSWQTDLAGLEGKVLIGTPQQAAEKLMPYLALGVEYFVLSIGTPYDMTMVELYINEVAKAVERMRG